MVQPTICVGIVSNPIIRFRLNGIFRLEQTGMFVEGEQVVEFSEGVIRFGNQSFATFSLRPVYSQAASFDVPDVKIGIQFHWERLETQTFQGSLRFVIDNQQCVLINELPVEEYLLSVISSEMNATSSLELLKAHAITSRSWLLAQLANKKSETTCTASRPQGQDEIIRWYDRENHALFDVCADDHCQRYQGITKVTSPIVKEAVRKTAGMILMYEDQVCDARFSKCCGGITEEFENCWQPVHIPYLESVTCCNTPPAFTSWEEWIRTSPPAFCNTHDFSVLSQVLNDYDQETSDFYRWSVTYTQQEISALIYKKTGVDFGQIQALLPLERGKSGRIVRLEIVGTARTMVIGKELEIRRTLSETHLYSSAFVVDVPARDANSLPRSFVLTGAGWGHGVGLCQIGAAMMAAEGYTAHEILRRYFNHSNIKRAYF